MFAQKSPKQNTQYINAEATFGALEQAHKDAAPFAGSMFWREISGKKYLIRWTPPDRQKSLGPLDEDNAHAVEKFRQGKQASQARIKSFRRVENNCKRLSTTRASKSTLCAAWPAMLTPIRCA